MIRRLSYVMVSISWVFIIVTPCLLAATFVTNGFAFFAWFAFVLAWVLFCQSGETDVYDWATS